ncbi:hypothetical protein F5X98DRAFT_330126, partial [Xylaria grammica]
MNFITGNTKLLENSAMAHICVIYASSDVKPRNILTKTSEINEMFQYAQSKVLDPFNPPYDPPTDYYVKSERVISGS